MLKTIDLACLEHVRGGQDDKQSHLVRRGCEALAADYRVPEEMDYPGRAQHVRERNAPYEQICAAAGRPIRGGLLSQ